MRDYANIVTAIWRDERFRSLSGSAQRTYLMLVTQDDISGAGTLPLTIRRWATNAADTTRDGIEHDLKVLEAAGFVFTDEDTEEVLIRTFVKHDKGYTNPKRKPVILVAAKGILSPKLRRVLWIELAKLGLEDSLPPLPDTSMDSLSDSHTPENRVVVTVVGTDTSTLNPQPVPPPAVAASRTTGTDVALFDAPETPAPPPNAGQLVAYWLERCRQRPPERVIGQMSREIKRLIEDNIDPANIEAGIDEWLTKDLSPANLASLVNSAMNRRQPNGRASPQNGQMATTDRKILAGQQLAAQLRALEGGQR